jgi:hypothetical protein
MALQGKTDNIRNVFSRANDLLKTMNANAPDKKEFFNIVYVTFQESTIGMNNYFNDTTTVANTQFTYIDLSSAIVANSEKKVPVIINDSRVTIKSNNSYSDKITERIAEYVQKYDIDTKVVEDNIYIGIADGEFFFYVKNEDPNNVIVSSSNTPPGPNDSDYEKEKYDNRFIKVGDNVIYIKLPFHSEVRAIDLQRTLGSATSSAVGKLFSFNKGGKTHRGRKTKKGKKSKKSKKNRTRK